MDTSLIDQSHKKTIHQPNVPSWHQCFGTAILMMSLVFWQTTQDVLAAAESVTSITTSQISIRFAGDTPIDVERSTWTLNGIAIYPACFYSSAGATETIQCHVQATQTSAYKSDTFSGPSKHGIIAKVRVIEGEHPTANHEVSISFQYRYPYGERAPEETASHVPIRKTHIENSQALIEVEAEVDTAMKPSSSNPIVIDSDNSQWYITISIPTFTD